MLGTQQQPSYVGTVAVASVLPGLRQAWDGNDHKKENVFISVVSGSSGTIRSPQLSTRTLRTFCAGEQD